MIRNRVGRVVAIIVGVILFTFVGGELVLHLWNWLLPPLFGWRTLTFWQALGLLLLCRILFGRMGGRGWGRSNFRGRMKERWDRMTPEEREKFRHGMRRGCVPWNTDPAAEPKP